MRDERAGKRGFSIRLKGPAYPTVILHFVFHEAKTMFFCFIPALLSSVDYFVSETIINSPPCGAFH